MVGRRDGREEGWQGGGREGEGGWREEREG